MENYRDAKIAAAILNPKDWSQVFFIELIQQETLWPVLIVSEQGSGQFKRDTQQIISLMIGNVYYRPSAIN